MLLILFYLHSYLIKKILRDKFLSQNYFIRIFVSFVAFVD